MSWKKHFHKYNNRRAHFIIGASGFVILGFAFFVFHHTSIGGFGIKPDVAESSEIVISEPPKPKHISTPESVKAIYMTSWVAGTKDWRKELVEFIKKSEINSIIIDVKDYTGRVAFATGDKEIEMVGSEEIRVRDLKDFIETLHDAEIYTIARITVFQDPYYAKKHPEIAVQKKNGTIWKDRKGLSYMDPAARPFWDYIIKIAKSSEQVGFDELNFDYIRFPSDGNMSDIVFPVAGKRKKVEVLSEFFAYLNRHLEETNVPISADVFGMTTTNYDDLNIGQVLEAIEPHFDYIAPMVYPSHYPPGFQNYKNPAAHPYEIIHYAMTKGVERMIKASSTPSKLRPWLQDFDLGAEYDAAKIRAQIQATYDSGLNSWMIWDPSNKYTRGAYELE